MKRIILLLGIVALSITAVLTSRVYAGLGVGVGVGKVQVDEKLRPGTVYKLPQLSVLNTGDEISDYEITIEYHETQKELRPARDWFTFSPQKFNLKPQDIQQIEVTLSLPLKMEPGNYFAYVEAHPVATTNQGGTSIGIAAATKLYFTVEPASPLAGIYYRVLSLWKLYTPWPQRVLIVLAIVLAVILFKRFFNIQINVKKPTNSS